jgi:predicted enzyme related to lactoylglutathione lyase
LQDNKKYKQLIKMKKTIFIILALAASFGFGFYFKTLITKQEVSNINSKQTKNINKMKKVTGIGGIFFKCKDPNKLKEWYKIHLGFDTDPYGTRFEWSESTDPSKKGITQWSLFSETDKYFDPSTKDFMINYRVENLVSLVEQLKKEGVIIIDKIETYEYGKFVHIMDIEGNKIELWEPNPDFSTTNK